MANTQKPLLRCLHELAAVALADVYARRSVFQVKMFDVRSAAPDIVEDNHRLLLGVQTYIHSSI